MTAQYKELVRKVLFFGEETSNRTGIDTISKFGESIKYDLADGFPIITTRKLPLRLAIVELLWMLRGDTNIAWLKENGVHFWDQWADDQGRLGPLYGAMWRRFPNIDGGMPIDQISELMYQLKKNPTSRRHVVSCWHPALLPDLLIPLEENPSKGRQVLAPCHWMFEVNCQPYHDTYRVNLHVHLRSNDLPAGHPVNVMFYSLLTHMIAQQLDYEVGELWVTMTDCHIYSNQVKQMQELLSRPLHDLPTLRIKRKPNSIFEYNVDDFELEGLVQGDPIKIPVAR